MCLGGIKVVFCLALKANLIHRIGLIGFTAVRPYSEQIPVIRRLSLEGLSLIGWIG